MNTGVVLGVANQNFDLKKKNLVNVNNIVIGQVAPPIGWGNSNLGAGSSLSTAPGVNSVNPGNVKFDTPRLTSTGTYTHVMTNGAAFYGCWVLNDTINAVYGNTGTEMGGLYVRPQITVSDGSAAQLCVGQDIVLTVRGTTTVDQTVSIGPASLLFGNVNNAYGVRSSIQTPDNAGNHIGKVALFQGLLLSGATNTVTTLIGLDLSLVNAAAGGISNSWGIQVGTANNYFQGNTMFGSTSAPSFPVDVIGVARVQQGGTALLGGTAVPTTTASGGSTLQAAPLLTSNGTYNVASGNDYIPWLLNDTITFTGTATNGQIYALGLYPSITASSGQTTPTGAGLSCNPTFIGTDTWSNLYGLTLNATIKAPATNAYGIFSLIVQNSANTVGTVTMIKAQALKLAGTITTLIGLDLTSLSGGTTTWGFQVGNYQSYHQGKLGIGGTSAPVNTVDIQGGMLNFHAVTDTYGTVVSIDVTTGNVHDITTTTVGNATFNATTGGIAGEILIILIHNDNTAGRTITFGSNFHSSGTLAGTAAKTATITFTSNGTAWYETARVLGIS